MDPLYDNYYNSDQRPSYNPNYNNYNNNYNARGNGYDNTNPALYEQMRERFNRGKIIANKNDQIAKLGDLKTSHHYY